MFDVSICNQALGIAGVRATISSLDEGSPEADACVRYYDDTRIELLMAVPWPFARRSAALSLTDVKEFGWDYSYLYPSDCLRPIFIMPNAVDVISGGGTNLGSVRDATDNLVYFVESTKPDGYGNVRRLISTNKEGAVLMYVADVKSSQVFSADFKAVFVQALAVKLVLNLTGNLNASNLQNNIANELLARATTQYKDEYDKDRRPVILDLLPLGLAARD